MRFLGDGGSQSIFITLMERHTPIATGAWRGFAGGGASLFESANERLTDHELSSHCSCFTAGIDSGEDPLS
jgi:hypothetical protein